MGSCAICTCKEMGSLKPQVVAKLREKAAVYETCIEVAKKLTWLVYQMPNAPKPLKPSLTHSAGATAMTA